MRFMLIKMLMISLLTVLSLSDLYGFTLDETAGGTATALGGAVLDKNLGGYNVIYNPSLISATLGDKPMSLEASVSGAYAPYGLEGIDNFAAGVTYGMNLGMLSAGAGLGFQGKRVVSGISEYRFYVGLAATYSDFAKLVSFLSFIDYASLGVNAKIISLNLDADAATLGDIPSSAFGFDLDVDVSLSFLQNWLSVGLMTHNLLDQSVNFISTPTYTNTTVRGLILHGKINVVKDFNIFAAVNLTGSEHLVDKNNFFGSSLAFVNTYFGIEASFDFLYVRVGLNEGRLTGGLGLTLDYLTINVGVLPISTLSLYYQLDINYKIF